MRFFYCRILLIVVLCIVCAQSEWTALYPTYDPPEGPVNTIFYDGVMFNRDEGCFAADIGIWVTKNGGKHWKRVFTTENSQNKYYSCCGFSFPTATHGWVAYSRNHWGDTTLLLFTKNSGKSWDSVFIDNVIVSLFFNDTVAGFAGSYKNVFKTTDAGKTWIPQKVPPNESFSINRLFFLNKKFGLGGTGAYGQCYMTTDSGNSWQRIVDSANINFQPVTSIFFTDSSNGYMTNKIQIKSSSGFSYLYITRDGGRHWKETNIDPCYYMRSVFFTGKDTGWIAGDYGYIYKTIDQGNSWHPVETPFFGDRNYSWRKVMFSPDKKYGLIMCMPFDVILQYNPATSVSANTSGSLFKNTSQPALQKMIIMKNIQSLYPAYHELYMYTVSGKRVGLFPAAAIGNYLQNSQPASGMYILRRK